MKLLTITVIASAVASHALAAEPDPARGQQVFNACAACHALEPDKNMTGPSLSGMWGRPAGTLASFPRFSEALKSSGVVWDDTTLDAWLADPQAFIPDNHMIFAGIPDEQARADLLAFLREATEPGVEIAQADDMGMGMDGMMSNEVPNLKTLPPNAHVTVITYCPDTYKVTTADGETTDFWERNLRFKTDSSEDGPEPGAPAIIGAGMVGDRASIIFAAPEEFGEFIKNECSN